MSAPRVNRTDFISGLGFTLLGVGAFIESLRMPRFEERAADPFTVPGLVPGLVSAALGLMGLALLLRSLRGGPAWAAQEPWGRAAVLRMAVTLITTLVYGLLLFGNAPFSIVTALFIFVFTVLAETINPDRQLPWPKVVLGAAALAIVAALGIEYVFREIFLVRLPGGMIW